MAYRSIRLLNGSPKGSMSDTCSLTKATGRFVKSHLLPKALTRGSNPGAPFIQGGYGNRPTRRWDSWYDKALVTRQGEDILSAIDDMGIAELRKHSLLWSGRGTGESDPKPDFFDSASRVGARTISNVDVHAVRMLILSLLWRCAASRRKEMEAIELSADQLEQLRIMLVEDRHTPSSSYPFTLTQLLEVGHVHNLAPLSTTLPSLSVNGTQSKPVPVFRFYIDGLIANVVREGWDEHDYGELPFNEEEGKMVVLTVETNRSFEMMNLKKHVVENETRWRHVVSRIGTFGGNSE